LTTHRTHLGGDVDVLPLDDALGNLSLDSCTHLILVLVEIGGVYVPVAHINRMQRGPLAIASKRLKERIVL